MRYVTLITLVYIAYSCSSSNKRTQLTQSEALVSDWYGKEIRMVEGLPCRVLGNDTLVGDMFSKPCKILVYVDSIGCTPCRLQLPEWKALLEEMKPVHDRVSVLFVFQPQNIEELDMLFLRYGVRTPYFQDEDEKFKKVNSFPGDMSSQVFLLDKDNRVVLVGSPIGNTKLWQLYRKQITIILDLPKGLWPEQKLQH